MKGRRGAEPYFGRRKRKCKGGKTKGGLTVRENTATPPQKGDIQGGGFTSRVQAG